MASLVIRHVILPKEMKKSLSKSHLMTETEWRNLGVQQSAGWIHYMIHDPGLFQRHMKLALILVR